MPEEFLLDCKLDQPSILAGQSADLYSLVTIRPNIPKLGALLESTGDSTIPAHLIVVVDVSGSMQTLIEDDPHARVVNRGQAEGLDVTYVEPLPVESPLWELANVIITPHVGAQAASRVDDSTQLAVRNLSRFFSGEQLLNIVDKKLGFPHPDVMAVNQ